MEFDIIGLEKILNKQSNLLEELRGLASEQLQALKQDDLNTIINITSRQEYIGRQLGILEKQRQIIINSLSLEQGIDIEHFSDLRPHTSRDNFAKLQKVRDKIVSECQKLKKENELNSLLIKQGLKYTEKILKILNGSNSTMYGKSGDMYNVSSRGIIDTNV